MSEPTSKLAVAGVFSQLIKVHSHRKHTLTWQSIRGTEFDLNGLSPVEQSNALLVGIQQANPTKILSTLSL